VHIKESFLNMLKDAILRILVHILYLCRWDISARDHSVLFWQIFTTQEKNQCDSYKGFLWKNPLKLREFQWIFWGKSPYFKQLVPADHKNLAGFLKFSNFLSPVTKFG
jgi:hypothetical protein